MLMNALNRLEEALLALLLAAMTLVTFVQVVLRYVFNAGFVWALELTIFLFAWLVLLGMSYAVRVGAHIGVDLLVKHLPPTPHKIVSLIAIALCMLYAAVLAYGGWSHTFGDPYASLYALALPPEDLCIPSQAFESGCVSRWLIEIIVPLGFVLLFLRFAQVGYNLLTGRDTGLHLADEVDEAIEHLKHEHEYPEHAEDQKYRHGYHYDEDADKRD